MRLLEDLKDRFIRRWLHDDYTLPWRHRRIKDYRAVIRQGHKIYIRALLDTGIKLDEDSPTIGDIGCGDGAFAMELATWHKSVSYVGFEIQEPWVPLLNQVFDSRRFRFEHLDVYHKTYNPDGSMPPEELTLPVEDDLFDLVIVNSVFNHLGREVVERYLQELERTLNDGGLVWVGFLVARDPSDRWARDDKSYDHEHDGYYSDDADVGIDVLYPEDTFQKMAEQAGLTVESVRYGNWRNRKGSLKICDSAVLRKPASR